MEMSSKALRARFQSWYPVAYANEFRRTVSIVWWIFKPEDKQFRTARALITRLLHEIRLLEQQVQSSPHPDRMRILLIRAQVSASQLALEIRWKSEAARLADAFRSELEIAVMSPSLSRKDGGVIGDLGPVVMQIYDEVMAGSGRPADR